MLFHEGDICKYDYLLDQAEGLEDDSVSEYYEAKDGKHCMVLGPNYDDGFVPVFFLDEDVKDLTSGHHSSAEVLAESLKLVIRSR